MSLLPKTPTPDKIYLILEALGWSNWMSGPIPSQGGRRASRTCDKILPAHVYHNEERQRHGLFSGLVLSMLVVRPLQPGVVGPYPVRDVWFPSHLLLEGTGHI
jgi:hypothetical protein